MGRPIPDIRNDMIALAHELAASGQFSWAARLGTLALDTYRNAPVHSSRIVSRKLTAKLASEIRKFAQANPDMSYKEMANAFDVNQGRISEALTHKK